MRYQIAIAEPGAFMSKTNNMSIGTMHNSQVQQDAQQSTQHLDQSVQHVDLSAFLEAFSQDIGKVSDPAVAQGLRADVETIRLQSAAPSPKKSIIKECLHSIRTILEGTAGSVLASYLPAVITLLGAL